MSLDAPDSPASQLIGGPIQEHPEARTNPINYITGEEPPFLIVHGDADRDILLHQAQLLRDALQRAGVPVTLYVVAGGGHGRFTDPEVLKVTRKFLDRYLKPSRP